MEPPNVECIKKVDLENDLTADTTELKNVVLLLDNENYNLTDLQCIEDSDGNLEINTIDNADILPNSANNVRNAQEVVEQPNAENEVTSGAEQDIDEDDQVIETEMVDDQFMGEDSFVNNLIGADDDISLHLVEDSDDGLYLDSDSELEEGHKFIDEIYEPKDEAHPCSICERIFKTAATLKRHIAVSHAIEERKHDDPLAFELCLCCSEPLDSAHQSGDFKCKDCGKLFVLQSSLSRHRSMEHSEDGSWRCVECPNVYTERELLIEHMRTHPFSKVYVCCYCGHEFSRKYHLERHNSQTGCDGNPRTAFQCEVCNKKFSRKDNLRDHLRAHTGHSKERKSFPCLYCKKEFKGSSLLTIHYRTHTGEKPYPCDLCPKRFPSSGAYRKHRRMHTGERPYQCNKCPSTFAAKETLNRHVRTHTGDKPHVCRFCGKTFIQAAQLRAHIFHHTGENAYTCHVCSRAFNRRNRLTQHVKFLHEGARPLQCDQCDRTFFRKEDLIRHNHLHTGVKPYQCEVCRKSFSLKSALKLHMLTHRKEEPCSCEECGRAFIRQDCLMRHMRAKHRDVLEDIMAGAEKKRLQQQLLSAASDAAIYGNKTKGESSVWDELSLTDSVKELLSLLVDEQTLTSFGWPDAQVDRLLDSVIKRCGHKPASQEDFDYLGRMRENVKLLFTVVIDDDAVKSLLNNQTVDEVILHVLRLAKSN